MRRRNLAIKVRPGIGRIAIGQFKAPSAGSDDRRRSCLSSPSKRFSESKSCQKTDSELCPTLRATPWCARRLQRRASSPGEAPARIMPGFAEWSAVADIQILHCAARVAALQALAEVQKNSVLLKGPNTRPAFGLPMVMAFEPELRGRSRRSRSVRPCRRRKAVAS